MALSEQQIGVIIDYASERVRELVNNYDTHAFEDDKDLQRLFIAISNLYDELNVTMADVLPRAIYQSYIKGVTKAEKLLEAADMGGVSLGSKGVANLVKAPLHVEAINNVLSDTLADLSAAIRTAKTYGINELDKAHNEVRRELADGLIAGFTTDQITKRVAEKFSERGMTSFITVDNKHLPLDFYAKTVTRTKLQTAENHGHLNRYNERNVKHVLVTGNIPTCGECAAYRGIVFATERGDKFPYINLYKTFPVHPNCRCNFRPWIKKFKSDEEIDQALETAKHFDPEKETRSKAEAKKYDANQKAKAAARQKRLTFNKMQAKLGKDGPQSFKEFKNASKRQYHDWVAQTKGLTNKNVQADVNDVILN
ncbi:phage minor capsid protein, partial [Staphylococcus xylosus]|uniref:phage minor capsid protein n=1 Tax=Staphylococcus xylosus TaxID=1288 RepID=UPI000D3F4E10